MKIFKTLLIAFLLAGCAEKQPFNLANYESNQTPIYPPISFILNDGYVATSSGCNQYSCYSYRDNSDIFLMNALRNTHLFERVDVNNAYAEYALDIKFYDTFKSSEGVEYSKMLFNIATLFLVPTTSDIKTHFSVTIRHKNEILKSYAYEAEYSKTNFLFIDKESGSKNAIEYFVSLLMKDIQADKIF